MSLSKGRMELSSMIDHFVIRPAQDCLEAAHRLESGWLVGERSWLVLEGCALRACVV